MRPLYKSISCALLACAAGLALTGCGGGGGEDHQPAVRFAAEGFWGGPDVNSVPVGPSTPPWNPGRDYFWGTPSTPGNHVGLVVLPDGETWGVYTASGVVVGALHGQTRVGPTGSTVLDTRFFSLGSGAPEISSISYDIKVAPRIQLDLTGDDNTHSGGQYLDGTHFVTTYDAYYDQPAALSQLSGSYTGTGGTTRGSNPGTRYTLSIANGVVTLPPDAVRCSGTGTVAPRPDKNVFNLHLQFSGAQCALGNGAQVNGIAVIENGHLMLIGSTLNVQDQFVFVSN